MTDTTSDPKNETTPASPVTWNGPAELDGPKVSGTAKGLKSAKGQLCVKGGKLIVKGLVSHEDLGYITDLRRVVFIDKDKTKAEWVFADGVLWTIAAPKKNDLPRFAEEVKKGLPQLDIAHEERKVSPVPGLIVLAVIIAVIVWGVKTCGPKDSQTEPSANAPQAGQTAPVAAAPKPPEAPANADPKGPMPLQSGWDGSVPCVKQYLEKNLNDPDSYESIEWSPVKADGDHWIVRNKYRAKNSFGAKIIKNQVFTFLNPHRDVDCVILEVVDLP